MALMALPVELRLNIISLVVFATGNAPDPTSLTSENRSLFKDVEYASWWVGSGVLYENAAHGYVPNGDGLLLATRQLREETLSLLNEVKVSLDIVLVNEKTLYPTWTCIPVGSRHIDVLEAQIRIFGPCEKDEVRSGFRGGCGGPPPMVWPFFNMVQRFLKVGPSGLVKPEIKHLDHHYTIGVLYVNVMTPTNLPDGCEIATVTDIRDWRHHKRRTSESQCIMPPELLCRFLSSYMSAIVWNDEHFAALIHERVGEIRFRVDGKEFDVNGRSNPGIDVGYLLATRFYANEPRKPYRKQIGKRYFSDWCIKATKNRERAGLPTYDLATAHQLKKEFFYADRCTGGCAG